MTSYAETLSTCTACGKDVPGLYYITDNGVLLSIACPDCGKQDEIVERDVQFFVKAYEYQDYKPMSYLIMPITYNCNLNCKFCYTHSNYSHQLPKDRSIEDIRDLIIKSGCPIVNLAGGEPTVRKDLPELLTVLKNETQVERICVVTNGQKTNNAEYLKSLRKAGMDFMFLPVYVPGYEIGGKVLNNIIASLKNAYEAAIPTWIQVTVESLDQIDYAFKVIEQYRKIIFSITLRAAAPYGIRNPEKRIYVSDLLKYLGKENDYGMGNHPFNRHVNLFGRKTKVSSWVNDRKMLDPYDAKYVDQHGDIIPFHKGMIFDDIYFKISKSHC